MTTDLKYKLCNIYKLQKTKSVAQTSTKFKFNQLSTCTFNEHIYGH